MTSDKLQCTVHSLLQVMMKFINPLPSSDLYVYHYTRVDTALNYILRDGTLRLNSFAAMNDPRENKSWTIATMIKPSFDLEPKDWDALSENVSNILKQNVKMACFSKDRETAVDKWQPDGLLDRGFARPSMWHHYANGHNGVCLMFSIEKLNVAFCKQVEPDRTFSGTVIYSDDGIILRMGHHPFCIDLTGFANISNLQSDPRFTIEVNNHLRRWMSELFFTKLKDWSNEEEFRWVYLDDNPQPLPLEFHDALEGIIIGEKVSSVHEEAFLKYCVLYKADIAHLEWRNGYPTIVHSGQPYITHKHLLNP